MDAYLTLAVLFYVFFTDQHKLFIGGKIVIFLSVVSLFYHTDMVFFVQAKLSVNISLSYTQLFIHWLCKYNFCILVPVLCYIGFCVPVSYLSVYTSIFAEDNKLDSIAHGMNAWMASSLLVLVIQWSIHLRLG